MSVLKAPQRPRCHGPQPLSPRRGLKTGEFHSSPMGSSGHVQVLNAISILKLVSQSPPLLDKSQLFVDKSQLLLDNSLTTFVGKNHEQSSFLLDT